MLKTDVYFDIPRETRKDPTVGQLSQFERPYLQNTPQNSRVFANFYLKTLASAITNKS